MKNNYYIDLMDQLLGIKFERLTQEEVNVLRAMGYDAVTWENNLRKGLITSEDVKARINIYNEFSTRIKKLDDDLTNRLSKQKEVQKPKYKKGDTFKTKKYGTILVYGIVEDNGVWYIQFTTENCERRYNSVVDFEKIISE